MLSVIKSALGTIGSLVWIALKVLMTVLVIGLFLVLFGPATYNDLVAGNYVQALLGGAVVLAIGIGTLWWLYNRIDVDVALPPDSSSAED